MDPVEDRRPRSGPRAVGNSCRQATAATLLLAGVEELLLRHVLATFLRRRFGLLGLPEQRCRPLRDRQQAGLVSLHLDDRFDLLEVHAEPLGDLAGGVVFEREASLGGFSLGNVVILLVVGVVVILRVGAAARDSAGAKRPEHNRREAGVRFEAGCVGVAEDHRKGFGRYRGPDLLEVLAERYHFAAGLLDPRVAGEDFEGRAEAGEDRISADDAFFGEAGHPLVDTRRQCGKY